MSELLRVLEVLFISDDIIANESLDKRRQPLLELSISGRHRGHYLWLLTQSYSAIPKNLRRQAKTIFVWYLKERADLKMMHDENDVLTDDELVVARSFLKKSKHACLYIQNEYPRGFRLLNHASGDYFKLAKYTHLMLSSYPKTSDVIEMVCQLGQFGPIVQILIRYLSHSQSLHLSAVPPFISRPDLFCNGEYLVAPTFETSVQRVFKGFLWFFKLSYNTLHLFPG